MYSDATKHTDKETSEPTYIHQKNHGYGECQDIDIVSSAQLQGSCTGRLSFKYH